MDAEPLEAARPSGSDRPSALNPGNASADNGYADVLTALGDLDRAMEFAVRSKELDPISVSPTHDLDFRTRTWEIGTSPSS